jgi:hypothetical protein
MRRILTTDPGRAKRESSNTSGKAALWLLRAELIPYEIAELTS